MYTPVTKTSRCIKFLWWLPSFAWQLYSSAPWDEIVNAGSSNPECVSVTNYAGLKSVAGAQGQGGTPMASWIYSNPSYNGVYWSVVSSDSCPSLTWTYTSGYQIGDNVASGR